MFAYSMDIFLYGSSFIYNIGNLLFIYSVRKIYNSRKYIDKIAVIFVMRKTIAVRL